MAVDGDVVTENEQAVEEELDGENIIMHCVLHNDPERLNRLFTDSADANHQAACTQLDERVKSGKTPLEMVSMLGRADVLRELIKHGSDVNLASPGGYTSLHFAACWGHLPCLEALVESGAKLDCRTKHGETARQLAVRYQKSDAVDFLDWAASKQTLASFIINIREMLADPEKMQGVKLTKDEKSTVLTSCNEKQEWLDTVTDATVEDFLLKKSDLEKQIELIMNKVNSPAPATGSSSGKK